MKIQEVILRAIDKHITWIQAAEIIRVSPRQLRRWRTGWEKYGYDGLFDRRLGKPSPKRVAVETIAEVFRLYREKYAGFSVKHFHEKLVEQHKISLSYTWVKAALQARGLVEKEAKRGVHRKKRERRPIPGLLRASSPGIGFVLDLRSGQVSVYRPLVSSGRQVQAFTAS